MTTTEKLGGRKMVLGLLFLLCSTLEIGGVIVAVVLGSATGWDAAGVATLLGAQAAGVWTVINGNVKEWEARLRNGHGSKPQEGSP